MLYTLRMTAPLLLNPVDTPKSWGRELWLNGTRPEAPARIDGDGTLGERLRAQPELLGDWTRRLHGDELPIFTKFIDADFPPYVHMGFARAVTRDELLQMLAREQDQLRALFVRLRIESRAAADELTRVYGAWATAQALAQWRRDDGAEVADELARVAGNPAHASQFRQHLGELRANRAAFVALLNEIDLRREAGNILLSPAGMIHAIFGLSHQTHPLDGARHELGRIGVELRRRAQAGAPEAELVALADAADLPSLRAANAAPPKNEAWLPLVRGDHLTLVEPQQTSDTTYSLADFYTPFVWDGARLRFRKGDPTAGLDEATLSRYVAGLDLSATRLDDLRRAPVPLRSVEGAALHVIVDDPAAWPFFTAHRLDLDGAGFSGDRAPGTFQQLVVLEGECELVGGGARLRLSPSAPAFVPATLEGGWQISGHARVLVLSVPGPHRAF
jgi:mannose-6-phosphate isomerase class I